MEWELVKTEYLLGKSIESNKTGQTPLIPKYRRHFLNRETGEYSEVTDLDAKKHKRTNSLLFFRESYIRLFKEGKVSLFSAVVYQENYERIGKFINTISRKFSRNGCFRLGHVWVRDIGDKEFRKHFHVLIATEPLSKREFQKMFSNINPNYYKIEEVDTVVGITEYLIDKELFAGKRQRAYQSSKKFRKPKAL